MKRALIGFAAAAAILGGCDNQARDPNAKPYYGDIVCKGPGGKVYQGLKSGSAGKELQMTYLSPQEKVVLVAERFGRAVRTEEMLQMTAFCALGLEGFRPKPN